MKWRGWIPWSLFFECWFLSQLFHSPLSLSPRASLVPFCFLLVTTSHGLSNLKNRHLSLIVLEVEKSVIKVLVDSIPGEVPLPACRCHLLIVFSQSKERKQAMVSLPLLIRTLMPSWGGGSTFKIPSKPNYLPKSPVPKTITLAFRASTGEHIQSITYAEHPEFWYNLLEVSHTL